MDKEVKRKNFIQHLLDYKQAMRNCIQNGANSEEMKRITKEYGLTLSTPLWYNRGGGFKLPAYIRYVRTGNLKKKTTNSLDVSDNHRIFAAEK